MTQLILKRVAASRTSGEWNDDDFDVLADGAAVGRILKVHAAPVGWPWMWTLAFGHHEDRGALGAPQVPTPVQTARLRGRPASRPPKSSSLRSTYTFADRRSAFGGKADISPDCQTIAIYEFAVSSTC